MSARLKGQETKISFTGPGGDFDLPFILSFEWTMDMEILESQFLGNTSKSFDDIFHGFSGQVEAQLDSATILKMQERIQFRAQRREAAGGVFSATSRFAFARGGSARVVFPDIFWGPIPMKASERAQYVTTTLEWKCDSIRRIL
jgi:hypothetical protein